MLFGVLGSGAVADAAESIGWASGVRLKEQLATPLSVSWDNAPLERVFASLGKSQHIAILRDRRIDPEQPIKLAIDGEPLSEVLAKIARHLKVGYCQLGPVAYFGPAEMAGRLRTLAALRLDDARRLPRAATRKFLRMRNWHWDRLAEPRDLARRLADEVGAELVHAERIGHDLWPEAALPPLKWIDRLTLLAAQFDLTFRIEDAGRRVELVEVPDEVALSRTYLGGRDAQRLAARWSQALPGAKIKIVGGRIRVDARLEDHEHLEARLRGTPTRRSNVIAGKAMYQLAVENAALDKVVERLEKQISLEVEWDRAAIEHSGIAVDQLISAQVAGATLDQLLEAVFAGTGLSFERTDRAVVIRPK